MIKKIKNYLNSKRQNFLSERRKKKLSKLIDKEKVKHLQPTIDKKSEWYGSSYGGFFIHPNLLNESSIIYSFGIGKDISFDLECIKRHKCKVFGFDPTPKSIDWINSQKINPLFSFKQYGIANETGEQSFFLPKNKNGVSGSLVGTEVVNKANSIQVKMKSFVDITSEFNHTKVDVLKMDIEGSEYEVLDSILKSSIPITQILVEFHDRLFDEKEEMSKLVVKKMNLAGYSIFAVSETFEEVSFIKIIN